MFDWLSMNWTAKPSSACQACGRVSEWVGDERERGGKMERTMWQCKSHAPGLFVSNAMANHPLVGSIATSLRRGLS